MSRHTSLLTLFLGSYLLACAPPLELRSRGDCTIIDVQRLGEYYSIVTEITVLSEDGKMVWRAKAAAGAQPKLHYIKLCAGKNAVVPEIRGQADLYEFESSGGGANFELESGHEYRIEVVGSGLGRPARAYFTLGATEPEPLFDRESSERSSNRLLDLGGAVTFDPSRDSPQKLSESTSSLLGVVRPDANNPH